MFFLPGCCIFFIYTQIHWTMWYLDHLRLWLKQRGLEIWKFFCPTENRVAYGRNLMHHFRFPFTTSITFYITSLRGNTVIHFGTTRQLIDWHDRHRFYLVLKFKSLRGWISFCSGLLEVTSEMTTAGKHWNYCVDSIDTDTQSFVWVSALISRLSVQNQRMHKLLQYASICLVYFMLCERICPSWPLERLE